MSRRPSVTALLAATLATVVAAPLLRAGKPLDRQVVIRRDTFGVPHILAESLEAAAFGLGYAQAEDHPVTLGRRVLEARGEAARVFGAAALDNDLAMRRVDNIGAAREHTGEIGREFRRALRAFADGVNRYAETHPLAVPPWMPRVTDTDLMAASRDDAVAAAFSRSFLERLEAKYATGAPVPTEGRRRPPHLRIPAGAARLSGGRPPDQHRRGATAVDEGPFVRDGSNALALSGSRTTTGHPLLLGNPHLRWSARYWEAHLTVPGRLNFYGSTLVGIPWLRAGFNDRLGYVQTNNAPDYQDVFALAADPDRPDHYLFDGRSRRLTRREVAVEVGGSDGPPTVERRTFWDSHLGPVVHRTPGRVFALKSAGLECWTHFEGFYALSQARSLAEYERTLARGLFYMSNFTYADVDGNVHYQWNTRLPRRVDDGTDYALDVPGEPRFVWRTLHPLTDLPRLLNPAGGVIQNANNAPWFVSRRDPLDPARYPGYVERRELALRPQIALQMLDARERFSPEDVIALKFTNRMLLADRVKPALLDAIAALVRPSPELHRAGAVLAAWDNRVDAGSRGAVLFQRFWDTHAREIAQPFAQPWDARRPYETPLGLADPAAALRHLEAAAAWSRTTFGGEDVAWGDVHRFRLGDIDLAADGAAGGLGLYRVMQFDEAPDGRRVAGHIAGTDDLAGSGDAWVLLVHFARPVRAWSVLAYGQSGDPASIHARDQLRLFAAHRLRPVWFTEAEIASHLTRAYPPGHAARGPR